MHLSTIYNSNNIITYVVRNLWKQCNVYLEQRSVTDIRTHWSCTCVPFSLTDVTRLNWSMTHILQTETDTRKRPNKCYQKLHICIMYDVTSHSTIKIHIVLLFPFVVNLNTSPLPVSSVEASSSKSVVREHSVSSVSECSVVFLEPKPQLEQSPGTTQLVRTETWIEHGSKLHPSAPSPYQTVQNKPQYKPFSI